MIAAARDAAEPLTATLGPCPVTLDVPGYSILQEIHRGGQGAVYRAIQHSTGRVVALKVMHQLFPDAAHLSRFDREVRVLAQLKHPNIVTIHDRGTAGGAHYFVMDYVQGRALDEHGAGRPTIEKVRLFAKICEALAVAHLRGIIHRDLKPGNIMVDEEGEPYVLDFGLAKLVGEFDDRTRATHMTCTGQFLGSLPWASPEQADSSERLDMRSDVYSLGVVLYQLLTGRFPYCVTGKMRDVLSRILDSDPVRPRSIAGDIDDELETIILKCLAKEPERRYASALELACDVRRYLAGEPIEAKRESTLYVLRKRVARHRVVVTSGLIIIALLIASSVVGWTLYERSQGSLWSSYFSQARAHRVSLRQGQRFNALEALAGAARIKRTIELRHEAIAAMSVPDVRVLREWSPEDADPWVDADFAPDLEHYVLRGDRAFTLRRTRDDFEIVRVEGFGLHSFGRPAFSRDGRLCALADSGQYRVYEAESGSPVLAVPCNPAGRNVDFAPDGGQFVISVDGGISFHDLPSGAHRTIPLDDARHQRVRLDPGGGRVASWSDSSADIHVYDVATGSRVTSLTLPDRIEMLTWNPSGEFIAATSISTTCVFVCDIRNGSLRQTLSEPGGRQMTIGYSASGEWLFSSGWDNTTYFWESFSGRLMLSMPNQCRTTAVPDRLGWCERAGGRLTLGLLSYEPPVVRTITATRATEGQDNQLGPLIPHPSGRWIVLGRHDGLDILDAATLQPVGHLPIGKVQGTCFDPSGHQLVTIMSRGIAGTWPVDWKEGELRIGPPRVVYEHALPLKGAFLGDVSADGSVLALAPENEDAVVIDLAHAERGPRLLKHERCKGVALSVDGSLAATTTQHGQDVKIWDAPGGNLHFTLPIPTSAAVAFSSSGSRVFTATRLSTCVWDVRDGRLLARLPRKERPSGGCALVESPDGRMLAVLNERWCIELVDLATFQTIARLPAPDRDLLQHTSVAFSPDGAQLFAASFATNRIYAWDLRTIRSELAELRLDWDLPPLPPAAPTVDRRPLRVEIDLGDWGSPSRVANAARSEGQGKLPRQAE